MMILIKIIYIWIMLIVIVHGKICSQSLKNLLKLRKYHESNGVTSVQVKFKSFDDLNINCTNLVEYNIDILNLCPLNKNLLFNNNLNVKKFLDSFRFNEASLKNEHMSINNLKGFNLNTNSKSTYDQFANLMIYESKFNFYLNSTLLIKNDEYCMIKYFQQNTFTWSRKLTFQQVFYTQNVCPLVFFTELLEEIYFIGISNSLIYKNRLGFIDLNETNNPNLDSFKRNLFLVLFQVAYVDVTLKLINRDLFKHINVLYFTGYFNKIQNDLFKYFIEIKSIILDCDNLGLFVNNGLKWMDYLNKNQSKYDLAKSIYLILNDNNFLFKNNYIYPDSDLCLFKDFPHNRSIYPVISSPTNFECTCTLIWLLQYSSYYLNNDYTALDYNPRLPVFSIRHCIQNETLFKFLESCKFEERFNKCHNKFEVKLKTFKKTFLATNLFYTHKWLILIFDFYIRPILCLLSFFTNLLTIILIRNKNDHKLKINFKSIMYKHILAFSFFNMIYSLIVLISLINICVFQGTLHCSKIYRYESSQYFKIYIYYFLSNTFRLSSNVCYISFSISRYFLSTSKPSKYFNKFQNLNHKLFTLIVFTISLILSLFKIFQFRVNTRSDSLDINYPYDAYGISYCNTEIVDLVYLESSNKFKCKMFSAFNITNDILNNIIFFFVSIFIDIGLIRFTNKNLSRKKRLFTNESSNSIHDAIKLKQKINKMIITNGVLYFFSHVPEFLMTILMLNINRNYSSYCMYRFSCIELIEIVQSFNFFSLILQIFVFLHFDKNFSESLKNIFGRVLIFIRWFNMKN